MQREVLYFNNFTIFPHNHRHSWALLEASCRSTPTPTFLSLAKIVPKIVIGYSGGAGRAGGALASGLVVAPASTHKLQSESLEKQKGGWKGWGRGNFQLLSWLLVEIVEFMHALLDLLFLDAGDVIYLLAPSCQLPPKYAAL